MILNKAKKHERFFQEVLNSAIYVGTGISTTPEISLKVLKKHLKNVHLLEALGITIKPKLLCTKNDVDVKISGTNIVDIVSSICYGTQISMIEVKSTTSRVTAMKMEHNKNINQLLRYFLCKTLIDGKYPNKVSVFYLSDTHTTSDTDAHNNKLRIKEMLQICTDFCSGSGTLITGEYMILQKSTDELRYEDIESGKYNFFKERA